MPDLIALDLDQDDSLVPIIEEIWAAGDALCTLDPRWSPILRSQALATMAPTVLLDGDGRHNLSEGRQVDSGIGLVMMTSGSISDPKAIELDHAALQASATITSRRLEVNPTLDHWLCCLPIVHIGGFSVLSRALLTGTSLSITKDAHPETLRRAAREGVSHVSLVTKAMLGIDPAMFSCILLGGAAPPDHLPPNAVVTYGMTETGSGIVYDGTALDGVSLHIVDSDEDGFGEIHVASPTLLRGYRDRPAPFVKGPDGEHNWFPTGDLGRLNDAGLLEVRGRLDEVIVTGGEKVYPSDVEAALINLNGIKELAVWKRSDPEWGERVVVWIAPEGTPPSLEEIQRMVSEQIASYATPKELVLVDVLPRTTLGKIRRSELR